MAYICHSWGHWNFTRCFGILFGSLQRPVLTQSVSENLIFSCCCNRVPLWAQCHLGIPVLPHRWSVGIPLETQSRSQSCAFGPWSTFCDKGGISGHKLRFWSEGCRLGLRELLMGPPNRSDLKLVSEKDFQGHKPVAFCVASASSLQQAQLCVLIRPTFSVTLFSSVSVADLPLRTYML